MNWLRPILLLAGALFMVLLIWWERRRPHRIRGGESHPGSRFEPHLGRNTEIDAARPGAPGVVREAVAGAARAAKTADEPRGFAREPPRAPPVVHWPPDDLPSPRAMPEVAAAGHPEPVAPTAPTSEPPLIVDWPEESACRIVTLRILPARHDRLAGRALRQGLTATGFRHGAFGIFHLPEPDGRVVLSAASLVRPGMLDPATMDFQRFAGINLFAVLPGPVSDDAALQRLGQVAVELASRVDGQIQEESGAPFNPAAGAAWRGRCLKAPRSAAGGPAH